MLKTKIRFGFLFLTLGLIGQLLLQSCEDKNSDPSFNVNFSYEFLDDNHLRFTNESEGEYYSMLWDFGNGTTASTEDRRENFEIFYPEAGDFKVALKVVDYTGNSKTASKIIKINTTILIVSFSIDIDPYNPNNVNLVNTTTGEFDSFKWLYRDKEIENEINPVAYFPFSGNYDIELQVSTGSDTFSSIQSVSISQDDPNYIENLKLIWSDEFDGSSVNTDNWTFETGATGWGNNELQNYTNGDNAEILDGKLIITARKVNENKELSSYTSSRMISRGKKEFTYGRMEIRAKLPTGTGIWPAIWMLGSNISTIGWPACGEIDIMEYVGYKPNTIYATVHTTSGYAGEGDGSSKIVESCEEEFHVYGLIWTEEELIFYTDTPDNITHIYAPGSKTADNWPFDQTQFFILNIAVGGNWGGLEGIDNTIFPQNLEIDYIRVYQEIN